MIPASWIPYVPGVYFLAVAFISLGVIRIIRWRRKTRWPFKPSDRLLRAPGETLRRQLADLDETLLFYFFGIVIVGGGVCLAAVYTITHYRLSGSNAAVVWMFMLGGAATISIYCLVTYSLQRTRLYLGWFGERLAAEKIRPLQAQGYHVFHDVPCDGAKKEFNIDHVVVGPAGVAAVEVKSRRKGNARPGFKDHEVTFDGRQLIWPWGEDRHGVEQAINEAEWLRKWIFERTGLRVAVKPILTLPGWYVHETPSPALRVVNPSFLPDVIHGRGELVLTPAQIDLIRRQLEDRCRTVEE